MWNWCHTYLAAVYAENPFCGTQKGFIYVNTHSLNYSTIQYNYYSTIISVQVVKYTNSKVHGHCHIVTNYCFSFIISYRSLFEYADTDGNGSVSFDELQNIIEMYPDIVDNLIL